MHETAVATTAGVAQVFDLHAPNGGVILLEATPRVLPAMPGVAEGSAGG